MQQHRHRAGHGVVAAAAVVAVVVACAALVVQARGVVAAPRRRAKAAGSLWKALRRECELTTCASYVTSPTASTSSSTPSTSAGGDAAVAAVLAGSAPANRDDWYIVGACVDHCAAPSCYASVYGAAPLEAGEVDRARATQYSSCVRQLEADLRTRSLWPPRRDPATGVLAEVAAAEPAAAGGSGGGAT